ncbi:hypothetical protein K438DRAFT_243196 [Mycena galopus ATCC 62051]|nr:hypothetical protein K438DRAFT_243196 [Mycena galopus ATCC 62051]
MTLGVHMMEECSSSIWVPWLWVSAAAATSTKYVSRRHSPTLVHFPRNRKRGPAFAGIQPQAFYGFSHEFEDPAPTRRRIGKTLRISGTRSFACRNSLISEIYPGLRAGPASKLRDCYWTTQPWTTYATSKVLHLAFRRAIFSKHSSVHFIWSRG